MLLSSSSSGPVLRIPPPEPGGAHPEPPPPPRLPRAVARVSRPPMRPARLQKSPRHSRTPKFAEHKTPSRSPPTGRDPRDPRTPTRHQKFADPHKSVRHPRTPKKSADTQQFADTHNLGRPQKASESAWKIADSHVSRRRKPAGDFSGTSTSRKQKRSLRSPAHISSPGSAPLSPAWNPSREEGESLDALGQRGRFRGKGGRRGGENGCLQMPRNFLWLCLSMGVRKSRSGRYWGGGGPRHPRTPKFAEGKTPGRRPAIEGSPRTPTRQKSADTHNSVRHPRAPKSSQTPTILAVLKKPRNPRGKLRTAIFLGEGSPREIFPAPQRRENKSDPLEALPISPRPAALPVPRGTIPLGRGESADTHRQKSAEAANPQSPDPGTGKRLAQRLTAPWGCSCLESAERPRRRCGRGLGGRGLQRPESTEGPRPRSPSFFPFPPARRLSTGDE